MAFDLKPADEFSGQVLCISRTAAVAKEKKLAAVAQTLSDERRCLNNAFTAILSYLVSQVGSGSERV
jgi:hypothetical protein